MRHLIHLAAASTLLIGISAAPAEAHNGWRRITPAMDKQLDSFVGPGHHRDWTRCKIRNEHGTAVAKCKGHRFYVS